MATRKKFIDIELPLIDETISVLGTPESLKSKTIKLDLTRKLRGKSLEIIFKIFGQEQNLTGYPAKMQLMKFYIRRMMRKRANYVEDSFQAQTKDLKVIIKPFLITRKKVSRAVRANLRRTAKEFLIEYIKNKSYLEICKQILNSDVQKLMLPKLKKVYPLSFSDIRVFETKELDKIEMKKPKTEKPKETKSKEKKEEKEKPSTKKETKKKTEKKIEKKPVKEKPVKKETKTKEKTEKKEE